MSGQNMSDFRKAASESIARIPGMGILLRRGRNMSSHAPRGNIRPDAPRPDGFPAAMRATTTQSVEDGIPTRSVGTRSNPPLSSDYDSFIGIEIKRA